jgi:hypothetical protein
MLLAFFVVMATAASVDKGRAERVRDSVRVAFAQESVRPDHLAELSVSQALQARVSAQFGAILPAGGSPVLRNDDRVDFDLPLGMLTAGGLADIGDNIATLLRASPPGYRYGVMLTGESASATDAAANLATVLIAHGVPPEALMVGTDRTGDGRLRVSFLLFDGDSEEDAALVIATLGAGARP